jgi:tetratricopeptide (TPR) repeat protein
MKRGKGSFALDLDGTGYGGGGYGRIHRPRRPVPPTARIKVLAQDVGGGGPAVREAGRLASLRAEVARSPLRRAARLRLVQALEQSGQLEEALEAARAWLKLDREHSGAVRAEAAILAALGSGRETLRAFASLADLAPRDARLHRGLASMFQAKGEAAAACAHRRALQSLSPSDGEAALGLARCLATQGDWDEARLAAQPALSARDRDVQREATRLVDDLAVRRPPPDEMPSLAAGLWARDDLVVEARWDGTSDLDVVVRLPSGERLAAHAPLPRGARVSDQRSGGSARSEAVTLRSARAGRYLVEVSRFGGASAAQPVRGELVIRALRGGRRSVAFELPAGRSNTRVAEVEITPAGWTY